jgi:HTH-type transcriptional regulator/antitoxin HigA
MAKFRGSSKDVPARGRRSGRKPGVYRIQHLREQLSTRDRDFLQGQNNPDPACADARRVRQRKVEMSARRGNALNERLYTKLLAKALPRVIHTKEENERCIANLETFLRKPNRTAEEDRLTELLTLLIETFEEKNYSLPAATPIEIVRHLMESNGLRQVDLIDVFGTPSIASEVLNGRRGLAKSHISKLSQRFNVSPELFFAAG